MYNMRVVDSSSASVTVEVTKVIEVDRRYRISPSDGYMGITTGVVTVYNLGKYRDTEVGEDDNGVNILDMIEAYMEAELSIVDDSDIAEHTQYLDDAIWVTYYYPGHVEEQGEYYVFPLQEFVGHIHMG